jgi:hypothetical protein
MIPNNMKQDGIFAIFLKYPKSILKTTDSIVITNWYKERKTS